jgi:hypothetical protein
MVTLELPSVVEQKLRAKAEAEGLTLEAFQVRVAEREATPVPVARVQLRGRLADAASNLSWEEFQQARREAWANFPRKAPSPKQP